MMKKEILICDDQPNIRESYKLILADDYDLVFAANGKDVLLYLQEKSPDFIIMDIKMPKMDGLTALKEIKKLHRDLPVLIVTGYHSVETASAALQAGALDYIVKPFEPEQIIKSVTKIFGGGL
ncbi:MAG: response regulator [Candidatus Omnitrophota bacterium]